ncbi:hypothetical protein PR048_032329 [Dryococelus australis]|uniref:Uncharacterized protein n=1 Tax=Dryococelus australis TaxID=614101 RepID=A0ABQ9G4S5_9NEOP|nr:hypothetical protein PR048_032329 [Dryococelus australis]
MGRLSAHKLSAATRPVFKVQYHKLVDDCSGDYGETGLSFAPPLPEYLSYCCCQCGHQQKLKVGKINVTSINGSDGHALAVYAVGTNTPEEARYGQCGSYENCRVGRQTANKLRGQQFKLVIVTSLLCSLFLPPPSLSPSPNFKPLPVRRIVMGFWSLEMLSPAGVSQGLFLSSKNTVVPFSIWAIDFRRRSSELFMICHSGPPVAILSVMLDLVTLIPVTFDLETQKILENPEETELIGERRPDVLRASDAILLTRSCWCFVGQAALSLLYSSYYSVGIRRPRSRSEGAIRATLTRTPSASSLLRARRAVFP